MKEDVDMFTDDKHRSYGQWANAIVCAIEWNTLLQFADHRIRNPTLKPCNH